MRTWRAIICVLLGLFVAVNVAYSSGADGVRFLRGGSASFDRGSDVALLKVREGVALLVDASSSDTDGGLAVVDVAAAMPPFSFLCGAYTPDGFVRDPAALQSVFGDRLHVTPHPMPGERARVTVDMSVDEAARQFQPMSVCNESCTTFNAAFLFLFAIVLAAGAVLWQRARAASRG